MYNIRARCVRWQAAKAHKVGMVETLPALKGAIVQFYVSLSLSLSLPRCCRHRITLNHSVL